MATETDLGGDPIPSDSDQALVPADIKRYADAISHKIIHRAADTAERDVLYSTADAPVLVLLDNGTLSIKLSDPPDNSWIDLFVPAGGSLTSSSVTVQSGWAAVSGQVERVTPNFVYLSVTVKRTGGTMAFDNTSDTHAGNIADTAVFSVGADFAPRQTSVGSFRSTFGGGECAIDTLGMCRILSGHPNMDIVNDQNVTLTLSYTINTSQTS